MSRHLYKSLVAAFALGAAFPSLASIPPSYEVAVVTHDRQEEAVNRALIEAMSAQNAFFWVRSKLSSGDLRECLLAEDTDKCVRDLVNSSGFSSVARPVVIIADVEDEIASWRCIGSGRHQAASTAGRARIDLKAALFGEDETRTKNLRAAMDCIYSAAHESSPA